MTVVLKNGSAFEVIPFSRDRGSYVTYGTFRYCIQNIDVGQGYQKRSYSDPEVSYPITEIQTSIDGTKLFENNKHLDSLTKVMILHLIECVIVFTACLLGIRSGYLRSIWFMALTLVAWVMTQVKAISRNHSRTTCRVWPNSKSRSRNPPSRSTTTSRSSFGTATAPDVDIA
ncbi:uncharacterized protein DFL_003400 [Arthrobotrys flagrans]|uniref:Uncharacterized protein n=1 Tax=Arthrobotrys flagrans TaxID=97331 RepID=A0A437A1R5_ARTFL|nr:hypothetical protein DFL_003400 [Arthrobotrys flagrans]